jgi:hypothetical protein
MPLAKPAEQAAAESEAATLLADTEDLAGDRNRVSATWARGATPGVVTVETLNQLVRENPVNVSQAIQNWLNRTTPTES